MSVGQSHHHYHNYCHGHQLSSWSSIIRTTSMRAIFIIRATILSLSVPQYHYNPCHQIIIICATILSGQCQCEPQSAKVPTLLWHRELSSSVVRFYHFHHDSLLRFAVRLIFIFKIYHHQAQWWDLIIFIIILDYQAQAQAQWWDSIIFHQQNLSSSSSSSTSSVVRLILIIKIDRIT